MALISTAYGDVQVGVTVSDDTLMGVPKVTFSLPLTHTLVQAGAFRPWQPVDVTIYDGDTQAGSRGPAVHLACYVTHPQRNGPMLDIELHDAAVWLQRRSAVRVTALAQPAGLHIQDLFANAIDQLERRTPQAFVPTDGTTASIWNGGDGATLASAYATAATSGVTLASRQLQPLGFRFTTSSTPSTVRVHLIGSVTAGVTWSNTLEVSVDGGTTWLASHSLGLTPESADVWVDVTGDTTWSAASLTYGNVRLRLTVNASATDVNEIWSLAYVEVEVASAASTDTLPVLAGYIDPGGPVITLDDQRRTLFDWFNWVADQTGWEWTTDYFARGVSSFTWMERIGEDVDVIQSPGLNAAGPEILSLEEGQLLSAPIQAGIDGMALYSRVRVTASGLVDVVATNTTLATLIGIHETILDLGTSATAADQAAIATQKLKELAAPMMQLSLIVPRTPALWGVLVPGNTVIVNLQAAPVLPYQGVARIVGRQIDDINDSLTIDVLTVQDLGSSAIAIGSGLKVQAPANTRKAMPATQRRKQFMGWLQLARRLARV